MLNFVVARAGIVVSFLGLLRSVVRIVFFEYINFYKFFCKFEFVFIVLFFGLFVEGFCILFEEVDGEVGGGMMDD